MKRKKIELKSEEDQDNRQIAAEERTLRLEHQMREKEFAHKERMMQYEIELARLKGEQARTTLGAHPISLGQEGCSANAFTPSMGTSNFGTDTTITTFPSLQNSCQWGLLDASGSKSQNNIP
jgi:hypothetical protein